MRIQSGSIWFGTSIDDGNLKLTVGNFHYDKDETYESICLDKQALKTLIFVLQQELEEMGG